MMPEGWSKVKLADCATIIMGQSPKSSDVNDSAKGLPFIQGNTEFGSRSPTPRKWIELPLKSAEAGDILVSVRAPVGEVNIADCRISIGRGVAAVRPAEADGLFLFFVLKSSEQYFSSISQGTTFDAINKDGLTDLVVMLPPLPEQRAIAEILDSVDATISATEATLEQTRRVKQALLQQLLTKGIDENGRPHTKFKMTEIGEIPEAWEVRTVVEACSLENKFRKPINRAEREKIKGQYPYYGPTGVLDHIAEYNFEGTYATLGEDGDHFLKWSSRDMSLLISGKFNVNNHAHVIGSSATCRAEWFFQFFRQRDITKHLTRQGVGRYKLTKAALGELLIAIPSIEEQMKIHNMMEFVRDLELTQSHELEQNKNLKRALMRDLLTGKVRVKDVKL